MDWIEVIKSRRSIRRYKIRPVERDKVLLAIDIATTAPSAGNLQPWRFITIENKQLQEALYRACYDQVWVYNAPFLVAVVADIERCKSEYGERGYEYAIESVSAAIQNFLIALHGLGLGAVWVGAFEQEKVDSLLSVPKGKKTIALIPIGYPNEKPEPKRVYDLKTRVFFNSYGLLYSKVWKILGNYASGKGELKYGIKKWINTIFKKVKEKEGKYKNIIRAKEACKGKQKVMKLGLKKEKGWFYFIDEDGDISRVPMKWKEREIENGG